MRGGEKGNSLSAHKLQVYVRASAVTALPTRRTSTPIDIAKDAESSKANFMFLLAVGTFDLPLGVYTCVSGWRERRRHDISSNPIS